MIETIQHRGPDDNGIFTFCDTGWAVNMGMCRLAIIDREHGSQPKHCGDITLIGNHEIYNYRSLRDTVGTPFSGDTETVARAWANYGENCLPMLDGMFALAVWDRNKETFYLARDRIGKKPCYYYWDESRNLLVFGSEIKAILAHPHFKKDINPQAIYYYLSLQYCPEPFTAFKGIMCVPPGGIVRYKPAEGKLEVDTWYNLKPDPHYTEGAVDPGDFVSWTRETVTEAITCRLESEVPLGVYLSGGIDSSIIAAVAKQHLKELHTFSMGFEEDAYSELPLARKTAEYLGTIHHEAIVRVPQLPEMAERIINQYDQPFGDCSAIPTMLLAEESKKYITVALTGDGGDEAFGGYPRYWMSDPKDGIYGYFNWMAPIPFGLCVRLLTPKFRDELKGVMHTQAWMLQQATSYLGDDLRNQMGWLDARTYLLNDIIPKMERASMAASIEARSPFLDHRVMELAFAIPSTLKIEGDTGKLILKDAFKDLLPLSAILRPKRGFSVPIGEWFRTNVGRRMLMEMTTDLDWPWGILDGPVVTAMLEAHCRSENPANYGHRIWMIFMLHLWMKRHFG
jgi:asparagine synthase (glutamine-hydrolysing)